MRLTQQFPDSKIILDVRERVRILERRRLGKCISILYRREQRYVNQMVKDYGLGYSDYKFLMYLSTHEGCSQKEMSKKMVVDEALTVRVVRKLQEKGYIVRKKTPEKSRHYKIYFTDKGRALVPQLQACLTSWWDQIMEGMEKEEQTELIRTMEFLTKRSESLMEEM